MFRSCSNDRPTRSLLKRLVIALVLLPFVAFLIFRGALSSSLRNLETRAHERGEPFSLAEVIATLPDVPDEENAATAIVDIWASEEGAFWTEWKTLRKTTTERKHRVVDENTPIIETTSSDKMPWPEKEMIAAKAFRDRYDDYYAQLTRALERPSARYPVNYSDGLDVALPHLAMWKRDISSLKMLALLALQEGNTKEALDHFHTMIRLTNTLKGEAQFISQLVRFAGISITTITLSEMVAWQQFNEDELDQMEAWLKTMKEDPAFQEALIMVRAESVAVFSFPAAKIANWGILPDWISESSVRSEIAVGFMRLSGWWSLDKRFLLSGYERVLLQTNSPSENLKAMKGINDELEREAVRFPPKLVSGWVLPPFFRVYEKHLQAEAQIGAAQIIVAIERYRAAHPNELPGDVDVLKAFGLPVVPLDPFDGQPLRFSVKTNGYCVYSVGADGVDNGGNSFRNTTDERDIVLEVKWPK